MSVPRDLPSPPPRPRRLREPDDTLGRFTPLRDLDETFIGTPSYQGRARFWDGTYDGLFKDAAPTRCRRAHAALLDAGLPVRGFSAEHDAVLSRALSTRIEHDPQTATDQACVSFRAQAALDRVASATEFRARLDAHLHAWQRREVTEALAAGVPVAAVARAARVHRQTVYRWLSALSTPGVLSVEQEQAGRG